MGRHRGTRHADAALVAVDLLRDASSSRSAMSSLYPGLAAAAPRDRRACSAGPAAASSTQEMAADAGAQGADRCARSPRTPIERLPGNPAADARGGARAAAPRSRSIASSATARARPARKGYPNLNDDDWLWGGDLKAIQYTIAHGVRQPDDDATRMSQMPAFGRDGILSRDADRGCRRPMSASSRSQEQAERRLAARRGAVRAQLRGLSRRGRQGQPRSSARRT